VGDESFSVRWVFDPQVYAARVMPLILVQTLTAYAISSLLAVLFLKWIFIYVPLPGQSLIIGFVVLAVIVGGVAQHRYHTLPTSVKGYRGQAFEARLTPAGLDTSSPEMTSHIAWRKILKTRFVRPRSAESYGAFYYEKNLFVLVPMTAEQFEAAERMRLSPEALSTSTSAPE
jgi:hypothetical protein